MNKAIELLLEQKEKYNKEIKHLQFELNENENLLHKALFEETCLLDEVLKHNVIDVINMIHKYNLKCSSMKSVETMWGDAEYTISDGRYFIKIVAENGTIAMNTKGIYNDGCDEDLKRKVNILIKNAIIPYCELNKHKYKK